MTSHILAPARAFAERYHGARAPLFNVSYRKVGGLYFIRIGRLCVAICLTNKPVRA